MALKKRALKAGSCTVMGTRPVEWSSTIPSTTAAHRTPSSVCGCAAPNNGKNSYATLIEPFCADNQGKGFCDEIDIVEYYGQTSNPRSEFTVHKNGQEPNAGWMVWPTPSDPGPGHIQTSYDIYLEPGNYLSWDLYAPDGATLGTWDIHSTDGFGYVPSRTMNLYVGIWDIGSIGINVDNPPGSFTGDSWMALSAIQVWTDF